MGRQQKTNRPETDHAKIPSPHFDPQPLEIDPTPWEEIEAGRFMPKRVRGSCQGRALG